MEPIPKKDPHHILGIPLEAGEEEIRARYLKLVREHPPERDPEMFRAIREAYEKVRDPITMARSLLTPVHQDDYEGWETVIEDQRETPPPLSVDFLLSLGNRERNYQPKSTP